jgi:hypothetical protein
MQIKSVSQLHNTYFFLIADQKYINTEFSEKYSIFDDLK